MPSPSGVGACRLRASSADGGAPSQGVIEIADCLVRMTTRHVSSPPIIVGIRVIGSQLDSPDYNHSTFAMDVAVESGS